MKISVPILVKSKCVVCRYGLQDIAMRIFFVVIATALSHASLHAAGTDEKPNIVFVLFYYLGY